MGYRAEVLSIPEALRTEMTGRSWHPDPRCPGFERLSLVRLVHWNFDGRPVEGELVVDARVAGDVARVFERIFDAGFPIERMTLIDAYGGDDNRSMADNNSSAFNFRTIAGSPNLSLHAFGTAIDINPVQNPYIAGERVLPPSAADYCDRTRLRPGMIVRPDPVTEAFDAIGWEWGGDWQPRKDYQHFAIRLG